MDRPAKIASETTAVESTRPTAKYMPSLGSRAPMFVKSTSVFDYTAMMYRMDDVLPRLSPANPPVTPWDDQTDDERGCTSPPQSPVNMLLATDLSEVVMNGRENTRLLKTDTKWPYLKQHAARHVYGNLRSRLQNRDLSSPPAVCLTYSPYDDLNKSLDGIQIQTFGIKPKSEPFRSSTSDEVHAPKSPTQVAREPKLTDKEKSYRISFKYPVNDTRSCVSAPPPTAESVVTTKCDINDSIPPKSIQCQPRRSKTAREYYRPKKDPLVKFDSMMLPSRLQHSPRPTSSHHPKIHARVTWTDVMAAKPNGVYRDPLGGVKGQSLQNNGSKVRLYLSPELWGILDEDITTIKTFAGKS